MKPVAFASSDNVPAVSAAVLTEGSRRHNGDISTGPELVLLAPLPGLANQTNGTVGAVQVLRDRNLVALGPEKYGS